MSDLSGEGARVLLVGTANHRGPTLPSVPPVGTTFEALRVRLVERCGVAPDRLVALFDPPAAMDIAAAVSWQANQATTTLLIYYVGHGLWGRDGELYLAAASTDALTPGLAGHQAYSLSELRQALAACRASSVVVVLDCCFSGRANLGVPTVSAAPELPPVHGAYLLGSAEDLAQAPEGQPLTTFSGELIRFLDTGSPRAGRLLTLDDAYEHVFAALRARNAPLPRRLEGGRSGRLVLAPNPAYIDSPYPPRRPAAPSAGPNPYPSLSAFGEQDAEFFCGREAVTEELRGLVADAVSEPGPLVVVGASGSGKTSLLQAGLLASIRQVGLGPAGSSGWPCRMITPGVMPLRTLAGLLDAADPEAALADPTVARDWLTAYLAGRPDQRLVLVIDQFEEAFTLCTAERERVAFIAALAAIAAGPAVVVVALRADFYPQAADHPLLADALRSRQFVLTSMSRDQLRVAIEVPAARARLTLDEGLVDLLLLELGSHRPQGPEPGSLPLLSHALAETWGRREGDRLTVRGYRDSGGIDGSIAQSADTTYAALDAEARRAAERTLPRLVRIGGDTVDTARPVPRDDFLRGVPTSAGERMLAAFTSARLISIDRDQVRLAHEALLRTWPLLSRWVDADREWLTVLQRLTSDAAEWIRSDQRDSSLLYRGNRLAGLRDRARQAIDAGELAPDTEQFVRASNRLDRRSAGLRRAAVVTLVVLLVGALVATVIAVQQRGATARTAQQATAQSLVASADAVRVSDPRLALQLGVAAVRLDPSPTAQASLAETLTASRYNGQLPAFTGQVSALALSPDGRTLAVGTSDSKLSLWNMSTVERPVLLTTLTTFHDGVTALTWSSDGTILVAGDDRTVTLLRAPTSNRPSVIGTLPGFGEPVTGIAWSTDMSVLAIGAHQDDYILTLHNGVLQVAAVLPVYAGQSFGGPSFSIALSSNGRVLAASTAAFGIQLWGLDDPTHPRQLGAPLTIPDSVISSAVFSTDDTVLATGGANASVQLWDIRDPAQPRQIYATGSSIGLWGSIDELAFDRNDEALVAAGTDGSPQVLALPTDKPLAERNPADLNTLIASNPGPPLTGQHAPVQAIAVDRTRQLLFSGSADGTVVIWGLGDAKLRPNHLGGLAGHLPGANQGSLAAAGTVLAGGGSDGEALLWNIHDPRRPRQLPTTAFAGQDERDTLSGAIAISPDGQLMATAGHADGTGVQLWQLSANGAATRIGPVLSDLGELNAVSWSPDGTTLVAADQKGLVAVYDVGEPAHPTRQSSWSQSGEITNVLMPAARNILVVTDRNGATVWDLANRHLPHRDATVVTGQVGSAVLTYRSSAALSSDGRLLVIGDSTNSFTIWDLTDPTKPSQLTSVLLVGRVGGVASLALTPDSNVLAEGNLDGSTLLFDLSDPRHPYQIGLPLFGQVLTDALAFLPDGRTLASQSITQTDLWDVSMVANVRANAVGLACSRLDGDGLDPLAWQHYAGGLPYRQTCPP